MLGSATPNKQVTNCQGFASSTRLSSKPRTTWRIRVAQCLLALVPILNVIWHPLSSVKIGGMSNIIPMDVLLAACWALALFTAIFRDSEMESSERLAWRIVFWTNVPLILSPLANILVSDGDNLVRGVLVHLKRIGLASVLVPLAVQGRLVQVRRLLISSFLGFVWFLYYGPPGWLPYVEASYEEVMVRSGRNVSLVFNPNTLAALACIAFLTLLVLLKLESGRVWKLGMLAGIAVSLLVFVSTGSRAATTSVIVAILYMMYKRRSYRILLLGLCVVVLMVLVEHPGFKNSVLITRWGTLLDYGMQERNIAVRIIEQSHAILRSPERPIGVGIGSKLERPTDSLYFNYLGSMGYLGLLSVLLVLRSCWRAQVPECPETIAARTVLVFAAVFSLAGFGIASNFVAPIFFLVIGLGASTSSSWDKRQLVFVSHSQGSAIEPIRNAV